MTDSSVNHSETDDERSPPPREPADSRRLLVGGFGLLASVLGFLLVRAIIDLRDLPADWTLFALPVFGVCGAVAFVLFVSAFLGLE
ncbi:hypothetical protein [Salinirubrum litoreum]|uniref:Uncharacterized protein n=1 Tax=Salinirubrum litoreum TaxID=1126234 RepID=A0ABD5RBI4_9EURY|nr:hypothetical protein [Salinirubrum litoreum]